MGVHTGEAEVRLDDYVGLDVHRAARICSAGHGGQVLISSSTRELVADELPPDVALRDLGEHRLTGARLSREADVFARER
jgi:class 3 adenylate cyclase